TMVCDGRSRALPQTHSMGGSCQGCFNVTTQAIYLSRVSALNVTLWRGNRKGTGFARGVPPLGTRNPDRELLRSGPPPPLRTQSVTAMTGRSRKDRAGHAVDLAMFFTFDF